ncbi:hypothetical protein F511_19863 [Dorcoceras hygrometricum]|uniref:Reverse transcriptase RNase H-like domain-containing protein n=1 Tax=Dorcoceras hygrometricum TaxID=472368 RepID=A0A2Z7CDP9_9LAMI|nr:hypothetical protein F511_19863 [Dorcoceras hygrometricum]
MQKKLIAKQARWQEFLTEFDFQWVHKAGKHNEVADALSQKYVHDYVAALTVIDSDFCGRIREAFVLDQVYQKLLDQVRNGDIRKYWIDDGLLFAKGSRAYVLVALFEKSCCRKLMIHNGLVTREPLACWPYCLESTIGQRWRTMWSIMFELVLFANWTRLKD